MTTADDRRGYLRRYNHWRAQLHWKIKFCHEVHPVTGVTCDRDLGHASLGATSRDRQHVGFDLSDGPGARATRVAWLDSGAERWHLNHVTARRHPASGDVPPGGRDRD